MHCWHMFQACVSEQTSAPKTRDIEVHGRRLLSWIKNIICSQAIRPVIFDPLPPLDPVKKTAATLVILCTLCLAMNEVDSF